MAALPQLARRTRPDPPLPQPETVWHSRAALAMQQMGDSGSAAAGPPQRPSTIPNGLLFRLGMDDGFTTAPDTDSIKRDLLSSLESSVAVFVKNHGEAGAMSYGLEVEFGNQTQHVQTMYDAGAP